MVGDCWSKKPTNQDKNQLSLGWLPTPGFKSCHLTIARMQINGVLLLEIALLHILLNQLTNLQRRQHSKIHLALFRWSTLLLLTKVSVHVKWISKYKSFIFTDGGQQKMRLHPAIIVFIILVVLNILRVIYYNLIASNE